MPETGNIDFTAWTFESIEGDQITLTESPNAYLRRHTGPSPYGCPGTHAPIQGEWTEKKTMTYSLQKLKAAYESIQQELEEARVNSPNPGIRVISHNPKEGTTLSEITNYAACLTHTRQEITPRQLQIWSLESILDSAKDFEKAA